MPPPLPVTVRGYVPVGVLDPTLMVIAATPEPVGVELDPGALQRVPQEDLRRQTGRVHALAAKVLRGPLHDLQHGPDPGGHDSGGLLGGGALSGGEPEDVHGMLPGGLVIRVPPQLKETLRRQEADHPGIAGVGVHEDDPLVRHPHHTDVVLTVPPIDDAGISRRDLGPQPGEISTGDVLVLEAQLGPGPGKALIIGSVEGSRARELSELGLRHRDAQHGQGISERSGATRKAPLLEVEQVLHAGFRTARSRARPSRRRARQSGQRSRSSPRAFPHHGQNSKAAWVGFPQWGQASVKIRGFVELGVGPAGAAARATGEGLPKALLTRRASVGLPHGDRLGARGAEPGEGG